MLDYTPEQILMIFMVDVGNRMMELAGAPEALSPDYRVVRGRANALRKHYRLAWSPRAEKGKLGLLQAKLKNDNPTALAFDWLPCGYRDEKQQIKAVALVPLAPKGTKSQNFNIRLSHAASQVIQGIIQAEAKHGHTVSRNEAIELALAAHVGPRCLDCNTPLVPIVLDDGGNSGFYECPECALGDEFKINPGASLDYVARKIESGGSGEPPAPHGWGYVLA